MSTPYLSSAALISTVIASLALAAGCSSHAAAPAPQGSGRDALTWSGQSYLPIGRNGGSNAMTWDGRLSLQQAPIPMDASAIKSAVLSTFPPGLTLRAEQSVGRGHLLLIMQGDCDLALYDTSASPRALLWDTNTSGKCSAPRAILQKDGNWVLSDGSGAIVWASMSSGYGSNTLEFLDGDPWLALVTTQNPNEVMWTTQHSDILGWQAKMFLPEYVSAHPSSDPTSVAAALQSSFSSPFVWAVPTTPPEAPPAKEFATEPLSIAALRGPTIAPAAGYPENPYRSDGDGKSQADGAYLTYQMQIYTPVIDDEISKPLMTLSAMAVVENPYTAEARVAKMRSTSPVKELLDQQGHPMVAIEPAVTFDGSLMVFHWFCEAESTTPPCANEADVGLVYYTFNAQDGTGWTVPKRLTELYADPNPALRAKGYPLARYPIRDGLGNLETAFYGAYLWLSEDGSDLFFESAIAADGGRRSGAAVVGGSTHGMVRLLDGGLNIDRMGHENLGFFSPGRMPGMWSPLEFMDNRVIPLNDKRFSYPMFDMFGTRYFEPSFEEPMSGDYDLFMDMVENLPSEANDRKNCGSNGKTSCNGRGYDVANTPDSSGNFHYGRKNAGAMFAEEAFPKACTTLSCPLKDPQSSKSNLFSGEPIFFNDSGGAIVVSGDASASGHVLLGDAQNLTVSVAVLPLEDLSTSGGARPLLRKPNTFGITLDGSRAVSATVYARSGGDVRKLTLTAPTPLPLQAWSHVAVTFASSTGTMSLYVHGDLVAQRSIDGAGAGPFPLDVDRSGLTIGPGDGGANAIVYALDQVAISRVVRSSQEIQRQANRVLPRLAVSPAPLPLGLKLKDVRSPRMLAGSLDPNAIELGRFLFFDARLSPEGKVSCSTCHDPSRAFTENLPLHPDRLASFGGPLDLLRNTPALVDLATKEQFFWDGRAATLQDQARTVIGSLHEMGPGIDAAATRLRTVGQYQRLFQVAFPSDPTPVNAGNIAAALEQFELSLVAGGSRFDQYMAGDLTALTEQERRGKALFFGKARCAECHSGSGFTDAFFHNPAFLGPTNSNQIEDDGRSVITGGQDDHFKFATPTLRNLARTGPYFHDGSVGSLEDVIALYNSVTADGSFAKNSGAIDGMLLPIHLGRDDVASLVAFLGTLESQVPQVSPPPYDDPVRPAPPRLTFATGATILAGAGIVQLDAAQLSFSTDGSLAVTDLAGTTLWSTGPLAACAGHPCTVVFGAGGLVVSNGTSTVWPPAPTPSGASLEVFSSEPYLRILEADGSIGWASSARFSSLKLKASQHARVSPPGEAPVILTMQADGNLVLRLESGSVVWTSSQFANFDVGGFNGPTQTMSCAGCFAVFQADGNMVSYMPSSAAAAYRAYWATQTAPSSGAKIVLSSRDPGLAVVAKDGSRLWPPAH